MKIIDFTNAIIPVDKVIFINIEGSVIHFHLEDNVKTHVNFPDEEGARTIFDIIKKCMKEDC